jgi:RNA polymerase sigma-70 factor (ECF subfamily)
VISADEQQLVSRLKQSDPAALESLFFQYHQQLCKVSFRLVNDVDKAKDIVQEVFIKLWKNREALEIAVSLQAYLKRAVINTSLNVIERDKRSRIVPLEKGLTETDQATAATPHEVSELEKRAHHAVENLPTRTKAVFKLIRMEDMSYKEVAVVLAISEKAVEKEMMKALKLLRRALTDYLPALIAAILFS